MDYELYHDESQRGGYWHGMLLVPVSQKDEVIEWLEKARENTRHQEPLAIKRVKNKDRIFYCANAWVQIGVGILRSRSKGITYPICCGKREQGKTQYDYLVDTLGAKFILFREKDAHAKMAGHSDHASKVETTFRMGLKGGLHFLGSDSSPISIERMHFDGQEHHRRDLDRDRIVGRIQGLRQYCSISTREDLIDARSSDHRLPGAQSYQDCQLIQFTDLLIGCFRTVLGVRTRPIHSELAHPVGLLLEKQLQGYARLRHSRWLGSLSISQCRLEEGAWRFESLDPNEGNIRTQPGLPF